MAYLRNFICSTNLSDNSGQFKIEKKTFTQQFSQIYYARLQALRPVILRNLTVTENSPQIGRVLDVEEGKISYIVGTVFCENIDRPNVFDEVENDLISNYRVDKYKKISNAKPIVFLEDESGRIELDVTLVSEYLWVTGTTLGLRGSADSFGKFHVDKIVEPGVPNVISCKTKALQNSGQYVAIVSGLHYGKDSAELSLERSKLIDFLSGSLHAEFGTKIVKLFIAGNSMSAPIKVANEYKKKYGHEIAKYKTDHLYQIDREFSSLSRSISIELMPGDEDLSNLSFPQNPVPKSLFPSLSKISTVNFTTNPCIADVDSVKFLGTSGQNIDDIFRHVDSEDRLLLAEKTLSWRNIAPTAPDSLYCYPFYEKDPFVLNESPNVYFIGNQPCFGTKKIQVNNEYITVVLVPDFSETRTIVLVNLDDLSAIPLTLDN